MQWKLVGRASLLLVVGMTQACVSAPDARQFGVPNLGDWHSRSLPTGAQLDRIESPGVAGRDETALAMTAFDEVQLSSWTASPVATKGPADGSIWLAHPSLPVPSYVEVTRLDNGRTVLARISARASGTKPELVAFSEGLARQLALGRTGVAAFRIRRVNPPEADRAALRQGQKAADRLDTPEFLLAVLRKKAAALPDIRARDVREAAARLTAPPSQHMVNPQKSAATQLLPATLTSASSPALTSARQAAELEGAEAGWFVQIAALSNATNAQWLASQMQGRIVPRNGLYRVVVGPFSTEASARSALGRLAMKGYPDARITR